MHKVPKMSDREVARAIEANIIAEHDSQLFRGGDDVFMRHQRVTAVYRALSQAVHV